MELGWMLVVLIAVVAAWHRAGQRVGQSIDPSRMAKLETQLSEWPAPEEFLKGQEEMLDRLEALEAGGHTLPAIVGRANDLTKDMLAMKTLLAEHREQLALLRTKNSLRAIGGSSEG